MFRIMALPDFLGFTPVPLRAQHNHYRGRLIGFVQREDLAGAMRVLGRLDRLAERLGDGLDLRELSERFDAFDDLAGAGSYRSDGNRL